MDCVIEPAVCPSAYCLSPSDTTVAAGHSCWCPIHVPLGLGIVRFLGLLAARANISLPRPYSGVHSSQGHHGESAGELWCISNTLSLILHHDLGCWCINSPAAFHRPWHHFETSVLPMLPSSSVFRLEGAIKFPAGFIGPGCMVSNSVGLEWDLRIHISNQCSSDSGQPWSIL